MKRSWSIGLFLIFISFVLYVTFLANTPSAQILGQMPEPTPCAQSTFPACNGGGCPDGQGCGALDTFTCECWTLCNNASAPACDGLCPLPETCTNQAGSCVCATPTPTPTPTSDPCSPDPCVSNPNFTKCCPAGSSTALARYVCCDQSQPCLITSTGEPDCGSSNPACNPTNPCPNNNTCCPTSSNGFFCCLRPTDLCLMTSCLATGTPDPNQCNPDPCAVGQVCCPGIPPFGYECCATGQICMGTNNDGSANCTFCGNGMIDPGEECEWYGDCQPPFPQVPKEVKSCVNCMCVPGDWTPTSFQPFSSDKKNQKLVAWKLPQKSTMKKIFQKLLSVN